MEPAIQLYRQYEMMEMHSLQDLMVFSKSEIHQRKLRQSANEANKHGKFASFAHSGHSRSKNGGLSSDNEKTIFKTFAHPFRAQP